MSTESPAPALGARLKLSIAHLSWPMTALISFRLPSLALGSLHGGTEPSEQRKRKRRDANLDCFVNTGLGSLVNMTVMVGSYTDSRPQ